MTDPKWAAQHPDPSKRVFAAKPAKVHIEFRTQRDGSASNPEDLLKAVARELNAQQPYEVEVNTVMRSHSTMYALVPHAAHDEKGQPIHPQPYMETPITLPEQRATIADFATQMANQLTQKTRNHFSCCQAAISGQPWGMAVMQYQAASKAAREVLVDLMKAAGRAEAYSSACEAHSHDFCFINVEMVRAFPRKAGVCRIPRYDPTE